MYTKNGAVEALEDFVDHLRQDGVVQLSLSRSLSKDGIKRVCLGLTFAWLNQHFRLFGFVLVDEIDAP